jgi:hypothetical protein
MAEFTGLAAELEAPLVVNEDVGGSWSKALSMNSEDSGGAELEWRLVSPTGGVTWTHSGPVSSRELGSVLDDYLFRSPFPDVAQINPGVNLGTRLSSLVLDSGLIDQLIEIDSPCPPPPFGRFETEAVVAFVNKASAASEASLRKLAEEHGSREGGTFVVVVFDGARAEEIPHLKNSLPEGFLALPDPDALIARRLGVRVWPSSVRVHETGVVTGFDMGADERDPRSGDLS